MSVARYLFATGIAIVVCVLLYAAAYAMCQHRANYAGGLVFVGRPVNAFGTEYYRMYLWRAADDTSPLPDASVYVDGKAHPLRDLSPELFKELLDDSQVREEGALVDSRGTWLQYRFQGGRLTWLSFDASDLGAHATNSGHHCAFAIGTRAAFTFPIGHDDLVEIAGEPERFYLHFAQ